MNYQQTIDYLYNSMPMFQREGKAAYKIGLGNIETLCAALGNPHLQFKSVHVAGTNGKGSSSHYLSAILQASQYKVGLFTSPHLKSFTERVKVNGVEVPQDFIVAFVAEHQLLFESVRPSFFELTTVLAFSYFASQKVDIAVIEVGMGGRLDSTNIITPLVALITNIGFDHEEYLGDTIAKIAVEKAGIIKNRVPIVVSEYQSDTIDVFENVAQNLQAPLIKAFEFYSVNASCTLHGLLQMDVVNTHSQNIFILQSELIGHYQLKNIVGVLAVIDTLKSIGYLISNECIELGVLNVIKLTGLKGRWQQLGISPLVFCDTGHNEAGLRLVIDQINAYSFQQLYIVLGMVNDKSHEKVLSLLPKNAYYLFCQASIPRALDAQKLCLMAQSIGLKGEIVKEVNEAIAKAKFLATVNDFIFIGGSTFVVAEIKEL
jgi:dihydrofolate synthase/folylpolyglutamate synthase